MAVLIGQEEDEPLTLFGGRSVMDNLLSPEGKAARIWVFNSAPFRNYARLSHLNALCGWLWNICGNGNISSHFREEPINPIDQANMEAGLDEMWREPNNYSNCLHFTTIMHAMAMQDFSWANQG